MGDFALDLAKFADKVPKRAKQVVDKIGQDLLRDIVLKTPVGNPRLWQSPPPAGYVGGRLRGNWNTGINAQDRTPRGVDKLGGAAIARGAATIRAREPDSDIYITNSLPYAERIEYGYSTQAPAGMLRVTVVRFQSFVNKALAS